MIKPVNSRGRMRVSDAPATLGDIPATIADALEVKDPYTHGHSLRVSKYSVAIAQSIGLDAEAIQQIEIGGHVHDIGKIGVREAVLNKPGPLTHEEYQHIMTHPVVGWRILSPLLRDVPMALNVVRSHHERWDGSGVPDHLVGEAIPIEGRWQPQRRTHDPALFDDERMGFLERLGCLDAALFPLDEEPPIPLGGYLETVRARTAALGQDEVQSDPEVSRVPA